MVFQKVCNTLAKNNLSSILSRYIFNHETKSFSSSSLCKKSKKKYVPKECSIPKKPKMMFKGKNALVVGGTSGIGFETARSLIISGAKGQVNSTSMTQSDRDYRSVYDGISIVREHVIITGQNDETCCTAVKRLKRCHGEGKASFICFDIRDAKEHEEALMYTVDKFCNLNILVNCFGMLNGQKWEDEISLNVESLIRSTLLGYDFMGTDSVGFGGVIINFAGTMGLEPMPGAPTFSACKHAVVGFSRSYGCPATQAETNVRLITICPGITHTGLWGKFRDKVMLNCECRLQKDLTMAKKQMAEVCGKSVCYLAKYADTGSVWVIEGSQLSELDFPHRDSYSILRRIYS